MSRRRRRQRRQKAARRRARQSLTTMRTPTWPLALALAANRFSKIDPAGKRRQKNVEWSFEESQTNSETFWRARTSSADGVRAAAVLLERCSVQGTLPVPRPQSESQIQTITPHHHAHRPRHHRRPRDRCFRSGRARFRFGRNVEISFLCRIFIFIHLTLSRLDSVFASHRRGGRIRRARGRDGH